ncbi:AbiV family abortive infection protein [Mucilaginibacter roseus]|uniref:AbiV family abortive infection protein n=1 Tax=Mucilaginibacter roseus TaxID=1528868 RepID=A0ABS8TZS7_9SPHI|nr:AbiV family abortive infection protein [Mucilaginibacter roseus]MCD8739310.1 AbiV family abortive infection protein [Mucilaginibacter roseus]
MNLTKTEILSLYNATIDNAHELLKAAHHNVFNYDGKKFIGLGISELALEELGKSFTLLAYYSKAQTINDWKQFWKDWRNHDVKAARGFFYEFFCTIRMEIENPNEPILNEPIPRGRFSTEKELAFYVDIDKSSRKIHLPEQHVSDEEAINRVVSLYGLLNPALFIKDWLNSLEPDGYKDAMSDYAYVALTEDVYQQDVPSILSALRNGNPDRDRALDEIWKMCDRKFNDEDTTEEQLTS